MRREMRTTSGGRRRRGGRGGPRERDARGAREGLGRAGRRRRWMPYRAVSWRGASIEWRCRGGKGEHVIASADRPASWTQSQKMMKLSSHSQSSVYVLCFAAASLDAPSSSRTARRCIAPPAANPKPRPVPAVVAARRPRASSIPSAGCDENEEKKKATMPTSPRRHFRSALLLPPLGSARRPSASLSVRPSVHPSPPTSLVANFPRPNAKPDAIRESINPSLVNHMAYLRVHSFASSAYLLGSVL